MGGKGSRGAPTEMTRARTQKALTPALGRRAPRAASRRVSVLIVDDDESIRDALADVLGDEGFEVLSAPNGQAALDLLSGRAVDVIVLDVLMPVMDGLAFLVARAGIAGVVSIPVILVTATPEDDVRRDLRGQDVKLPLLRKPFTSDVLIAMVRAATCP